MKTFRAFVGYLDLLGTKSRFEIDGRDNQKSNDFAHVRREITKMGDAMKIIEDNLGKPLSDDDIHNHVAGAFPFSDGVFYVAPANAPIEGIAHTDNELEFGCFVWAFSDCLGELIQNGFLARGRISVGEVGVKGNVVCGPAACLAARNESEICGPFIEVDPAVFSFLSEGYYWQRENLADPSGDVMKACNWYDKFLLNKTTGAVILNHMWSWFYQDVDTDLLLTGQKRVIELYGPKNEKACEKYFPLAVLHNHVIATEWPRLPIEHKPRFCISNEILNLLGSKEQPVFSDLREWMKPIRDRAFEKVWKKRLEEA